MSEFESGLLPAVARAAIAGALNVPATNPILPDSLLENGASFVTLHRHGQLRGCIGSLTAMRPLFEDIRDNALSAAFRDYRFKPLDHDEFVDTEISVSVLSEAVPITVESEMDAISKLVPGVDGVIIEFQGKRGTFLPQVWDQLPNAARFLTQLKQKAGLPLDFWHQDIRIARYRVDEYKENTIHG